MLLGDIISHAELSKLRKTRINDHTSVNIMLVYFDSHKMVAYSGGITYFYDF